MDKPWENEPDALDWMNDATGLRCAIRRVGYSGHLCGYVSVPPDHPWFGQGYDDIDVSVHGGLTYARDALVETSNDVPVWWIGFDCAHAGDLSPKSHESESEFYTRHGYVYRDVAYVRAEVESLARQVAARVEPDALQKDIEAAEAEIAAAQDRLNQARARLAELRGPDPGLAPALSA